MSRPSRILRRTAAAVVLAALAGSAASKEDPPHVVVFLAPADGPDGAAAGDVALGVEAALATTVFGEARATLRREPLPAPERMGDVLAAWKKSPPAIVLAWAPDGRTRSVEDLAQKAQRPTIVMSPETTRPFVDPARWVLWGGGVRTPDEALQAMDFLLLPLNSHKPAVLHDGSARGADAAARALRIHHVSQAPLAPAALPDPIDAAAAKALVASGADGIVYFGGPAGAERLLRATSAAALKVPVLLGQGLASAGVPTFADGKAPGAWALEAENFEDHRNEARDLHPVHDAAKAAGTRVRAGMVRGYRAGRWAVTALGAAGTNEPKKVLPALRALDRPAARGKRVFDDCGWGTLHRLGPWVSSDPKYGSEGPCVRSRFTLVPMQAIPQVGTFRPDLFEWPEGTLHVQCSWGEAPARTIERDLAGLGLHTGGYEAELEQRILDDLMGRFISRMNRLFLRNPDGTAIPGLSWKVGFTTAPPPKQAKGAKLKVFLMGDDPDTGGRASGSTANVFTTFLQRTIYLPQKLKTAISASDRPYLSGTYRWGTSVEQNLRCDDVRALVDGYTEAMSLTGAHEVGHLCGPNHDTESTRSIMNVVDAVGLSFDWAEWIPAHQKMLDGYLGREPAVKE